MSAGEKTGKRQLHLRGFAEDDAVDLRYRRVQRAGKGGIERRGRGGRGKRDGHAA
jgi:hypothetical protein